MFPSAERSRGRWALQRVCSLFWRPGGASWVELTTKLSVNEEQMECRLLLTSYCQYLLRVLLFLSLSSF